MVAQPEAIVEMKADEPVSLTGAATPRAACSRGSPGARRARYRASSRASANRTRRRSPHNPPEQGCRGNPAATPTRVAPLSLPHMARGRADCRSGAQSLARRPRGGPRRWPRAGWRTRPSPLCRRDSARRDAARPRGRRPVPRRGRRSRPRRPGARGPSSPSPARRRGGAPRRQPRRGRDRGCAGRRHRSGAGRCCGRWTRRDRAARAVAPIARASACS